MRSLSDFVPFVNEQLSFHRNMAAKFATDKRRSEKHNATALMFSDLLEAISGQPNLLDSVTTESAKPFQFFLSLEEVEGLPEELIQELSFSESDKTEYAILRIIEECGGVASIDRILFTLFKKTNEIMKRATLNSRLYRMMQKGQLFSVPTRKGIYSTKELSQREIDELS